MKDILLVDDEPSVVTALATSLRRVRSRYHVRVAARADDALRAMHTKPADVVITDMRMPGTDGEELLRELQIAWPSTVRLVLSGSVKPETSRRVAMLAHIFIAKPVESDQLVATLDRVSLVVDRLQRPELRALVGRMRRLPVLSSTSRALRTLLASPGATARALADVVEQSPSLTAKVLHLANSAFFNAGTSAVSVERAITVIGIETLQALVLVADIFAEAPRDGLVGSTLQQLQQRALFAARVARALTAPRQPQPAAWTAAMLHDIGLIALLAEGPSPLSEVIQRMATTGERIEEAEQSLWGATHEDVGAYLLGLWGFDWDVIEAVGAHHAPPSDESPTDAAGIARVSAALADELFPLCSNVPEPRGLPTLDEGDTMLASLHERWRTLARAELENYLETRHELSRS